MGRLTRSRLRRTLKILHLVGAGGMTGALAAHVALLLVIPMESMSEYAAARRGIEAISQYVLVPSLAVALATGMFALSVQPSFGNAGWFWIKAGLGYPMFHGTLVTIDSTAKSAAALSARVAAGDADPALLASAVAGEWTTLWILLALCLAQSALGAWRPRFSRAQARDRLSASRARS